MTTFEIPGDVDTPGQETIRVVLTGVAVDRLALGLCLIKEQLIDALMIVDRGGQRRLRIACDTGLTPHERARISHERILVGLDVSTTELQYLAVFFLRSARDGIAEVDHVDIEDQSRGSRNFGSMVEIKVDRAKPSMPREEAIRRLSIE